jgi:hypothetical protein
MPGTGTCPPVVLSVTTHQAARPAADLLQLRKALTAIYTILAPSVLFHGLEFEISFVQALDA